MSRGDLLALTPEGIVALANLGLVRRASREIEAGLGPEISEDAAGVVTGTFPDGVVARLEPGARLAATACSCGATAVCRHRVAVALAYPGWHAERSASRDVAPHAAPAEQQDVPWSPGGFSDEELARVLGKRALERAKALTSGELVVEIGRGADGDTSGTRTGSPVARLPTCSVRFLVPRDLAYARCDCAATRGCGHIAAAVWAFREADRRLQGGAVVTVVLGPARPRRAGAQPDDAPPGREPLGAALDLSHDLLAAGVVHVDPAVATRFAVARAPLDAAGLTWPATILDDLEEELLLYHQRSASYRPSRIADLHTELWARARAAASGGELPPAFVLGAGIARETLLDQVRLVSLGARALAEGSARRVEVFLADPGSGAVLVLARTFRHAEGDPPEDGPALERRAIAGRIHLGLLARGQLVSRSVRRKASLEIALGGARGPAQTSVTPQAGAWSTLPEGLRVVDYDKLTGDLRARPPRLLRPRVLADSVRVIEVRRVRAWLYAPAQQAVVADLEDAHGRRLRLSRRHHRAAPHALDAIVGALAGDRLRWVSGHVRLGAEGLTVDPIGLVTDRLIIPDLEAAAPGWDALVGVLPRDSSPLASAVQLARAVLEEACHTGLARPSSGWGARAQSAAGALAAVGVTQAAGRMRNLAVHVTAGRSRAAAEAWCSAAIRLALMEPWI